MTPTQTITALKRLGANIHSAGTTLSELKKAENPKKAERELINLKGRLQAALRSVEKMIEASTPALVEE